MQAWPLHWPHGMPRTKARTGDRFNTAVGTAVRNVMDELRRFGNDSGIKVESIVVSSNVTLTDQRPADPGVAAYFRWDKIDCAIAVDRYNRVEANLQAIAKVIEAERTKLRHGGLNIVRAGFRGFAALPPPTGSDGQIAPPWWSVLGFTAAPSITEAEARYRQLVKELHPDKGGDPARFNAVTDAIREARLAA